MTSLVNHSVTNLINGVSEQDPTIRLDNQLESQVNCYSDITRGLTRRNGVELMNVSPQDIRDSIKIKFNVDSEQHLLALNIADLVEPVKYVPITSDTTSLTSSIVDSFYFDNAKQEDIQILEDKDRVYILNKKSIVGSGNDRTTYFDIKVTNTATNSTDTEWDTGDYYVTIHGVSDPAYGIVPPVQSDILMSRTSTLQDLTDAINNDTALIGQTGKCTISGNISNYRISFKDVPTGFILPVCYTTANTNISYSYWTITDSSWRGGGGLYQVYWNPVRFTGTRFAGDNTSTWRWAGVDKARVAGLPESVSVTDTPTYKLSYIRGGQYKGSSREYYIKQREENFETDTYTTTTYTPSQDQGSANGATEAMLWVTGVSQDQEYNTTVTFYDINNPTVELTQSATFNTGSTTPANIKLNAVAFNLALGITQNQYLTATQYDNAVHIVTSAGYEIKQIETDNNFDTSSISSVVQAKENNASGIVTIDTLPPSFVEGFVLRVSPNSASNDDNYYMRYDSGFKGWKETALDVTRFIDKTTMPYVIDKQKVRETGEIVIEPIQWSGAEAGDEDSNKSPSFYERTINDMFLYGGRLGFATDDTLVLSQINEPLNFFRTTCSLVKSSDRVDIKLDGSKIGFYPIQHVVSYEGRLFINTGTNQSVLLVNNAFDLTTARLSEVSSYSLGTNEPASVGNGLYFSNTIGNITNIFNYVPLGNNTYEAIELTKHCPKFIKGQAKVMVYDSDLCAITTDSNDRELYIQNSYRSGGQMIQNAWHKWTLPYDIEHIFFRDNELYIIMNAEDSNTDRRTIITKYNLKPQDVEPVRDDIYIGWQPYLDCHTNDPTLIELFEDFTGVSTDTGFQFETVQEAKESLEQTQFDLGELSAEEYSLTSPVHYWRTSGQTNFLVWDDGTEEVFGNTALLTYDFGGYRYVRGTEQSTGEYAVARRTLTESEATGNEMLYGVPFEASLVLSEITMRQQGQDGYTVMNFARLMLRRMVLLLSNTGLLEVTVQIKNRPDVVAKYTGEPVGSFVLGRATIADFPFQFPINAKPDNVTITIRTLDSTPFSLLSTEWQGQLINKGRNI